MPTKYDDTLILRLASTTNSLRKLFYINLIFSSAIIYLVYHDPGFVSEKIGPALQTLEPVFRIYRYVKDNPDRFKDYRTNFDRTIQLTATSILTLQQKAEEVAKLDQAQQESLLNKLETAGISEKQLDDLTRTFTPESLK
jgi:hypothetical protein